MAELPAKKISELDATSISAFKGILKIGSRPLNDFGGKSVIWMGTSVAAIADAAIAAYPTLVARMLGFTLANKSIVGSKVIFDPVNSHYGMSMTAAEQITYNDVRAGNVSYQNQLTDNWDSDVFIFDHFHNESDTLDDLIDNASYWDSVKATFKITDLNKFDRTWSIGAMNYIIAEIYRKKPRAKIVLITGWANDLATTVLANKVVSEYWSIPLCELRMGSSNIAIVTTEEIAVPRYNRLSDVVLNTGSSANPRSLYSSGAPDDSDSSESPQTHTTTDIIHPGRYGRIMYAKHVAAFLFNNVFMDNDTAEYIT